LVGSCESVHNEREFRRPFGSPLREEASLTRRENAR
jgi:hypothetical protein